MPPVAPPTATTSTSAASAVSRRATAVGLVAAALAVVGRPARAAPPTQTREAAHPDIVVADPSVLQALRARDAAADFKCKGGMMDCDGDRRAFAKKQYKDFLAKRAAVEGGKQ